MFRYFQDNRDLEGEENAGYHDGEEVSPPCENQEEEEEGKVYKRRWYILVRNPVHKIQGFIYKKLDAFSFPFFWSLRLYFYLIKSVRAD